MLGPSPRDLCAIILGVQGLEMATKHSFRNPTSLQLVPHQISPLCQCLGVVAALFLAFTAHQPPCLHHGSHWESPHPWNWFGTQSTGLEPNQPPPEEEDYQSVFTNLAENVSSPHTFLSHHESTGGNRAPSIDIPQSVSSLVLGARQ